MDPTTIVAGLGRCGSSLTMQLLHAGGMRCLGRYPAFEDTRTMDQAQLPGLIDVMDGGAMKVLDPHVNRIPRDRACRVIWLDRDPMEQAKSQAKMMQQLLGFAEVSRNSRRALAASNKADRGRALASLNPSWPLLCLTFEALLARPRESYSRLVAFIPGLYPALDVERILHRRSAACRPDLALELSLLEARS